MKHVIRFIILSVLFLLNLYIDGVSANMFAMSKQTVAKQDSIRWFPSCEIYTSMFGSVPKMAFNIEPVIWETNYMYMSTRLTTMNRHKVYSYKSYINIYSQAIDELSGVLKGLSQLSAFFQVNITTGVKFAFMRLYTGCSLKMSRYNNDFNSLTYNLFWNLGVEINFSKYVFMKLNVNEYLQEYHALKDDLYKMFDDGSWHSSPYYKIGVGFGYRITNRIKNGDFKMPDYKNAIGVDFNAERPMFGIRYNRRIAKKGNNALLLTSVYRYDNHQWEYWNSDLNRTSQVKEVISNLSLGLNDKLYFTKKVALLGGASFGYYYVMDNDRGSYFADVKLNAGLSFRLNRYVCISYQRNFPLTYFLKNPSVRGRYVTHLINAYSTFNVSYVF